MRAQGTIVLGLVVEQERQDGMEHGLWCSGIYRTCNSNQIEMQCLLAGKNGAAQERRQAGSRLVPACTMQRHHMRYMITATKST